MISPKQWIISQKYGKKGAQQIQSQKTKGPQISPLKVKSGKQIKHPHPEAKTKLIGIRSGEKIHEVMISSDDAINTLEFDTYFVIQPSHPWWDNLEYIKINGGKPVDEGFTYSSGNNTQWLTIDKLKKMIANL